MEILLVFSKGFTVKGDAIVQLAWGSIVAHGHLLTMILPHLCPRVIVLPYLYCLISLKTITGQNINFNREKKLLLLL